MKISVFGLGYVGIISAVCLAENSHEVIGVETNDKKVSLINSGQSPIVEPQINESLKKVIESGNLKATTDYAEAIKSTQISLICVGTPSKSSGEVDLSYIFNVAEQFAQVLKKGKGRHTVLIRSTSMPGTAEKFASILTASGLKQYEDFDVLANPEFLREGTAVKDFYNPPLTLLGCADSESEKTVREMYSFLNAPFVTAAVKTAEMLKYVNNTFHALKVDYANEIARFCAAKEIDSREVMDIFLMDRKLNISEYYLKPGFAFGGSCLPKDVRALSYETKRMGIDLPVIGSVMKSNDIHLDWAFDLIMRSSAKRIGIFGLSFKNGTDDLRESPAVILVERLIGKGKDVKIFDENVNLTKLIGANKKYIEDEIKHISDVMTDNPERMIEESELIVIANRDSAYKKFFKDDLFSTKKIVDLVNLFPEKKSNDNYRGIGW